MNDESHVESKPGLAGNTETGSVPETQPNVSEPDPIQPALPAPLDEGVTNDVNVEQHRKHGESNVDKNDSEAETVVLSEKEESKDRELKKSIKLEEAGTVDSDSNHRLNNAQPIQEGKREDGADIEPRKPSLKRKRVMLDNHGSADPEAANSSNLSSTVSSPVQEPRSSKTTDTASNRSRSSPPSDEVAQGQERRAYKARTARNPVENHSGGGKSDRSSGLLTGRKRRDTRSATHYDEPNYRSESPPSRNNHRAQSIQSNAPPSGVTKRKRAPAPLYVERRRKASEDIHPESEDDGSIHSHPRHSRLLTIENNAMSPAKMVSSKKNRDRSGRTLLARACGSNEVTEVEKWLRERPQDIDVPDNAGNTPLQIAALAGYFDVVRLLLDAGCGIDFKNIDKDTPLIDAVENGHLEVVEILLKAGLDPRQTNAFGKEPLDLVKPDDENADRLREVLQASKREKAVLRRPSEDYNRQHSAGSRDAEQSTAIAPGTSPVNSTRSPPPAGPGARRRTARSQPTDESLLWVNATPATLRDAAGKGDMTIVDHILKMRPQADTESVLAAARGGHEDVLGVILAIAKLDPDPEPLRLSDYKPAYSTPMLAAIGRGNTNIIHLLLDQPGFDPTRRRYKGMTYYELAKERQGSEWQEEYDILKEAFDNFKQNGGKKSGNNSPRKVRPKRADSSKSGLDPSSSPHQARKMRKPSPLEEQSQEVNKVEHSYNTAALKNGGDGKHKLPHLTQDAELENFGPSKTKAREGRAGSEKEILNTQRSDISKPKRKLMSGNDFKMDQDIRRRTSLAGESDLPKRRSVEIVSKGDVRQRRFSDASETKPRVLHEESSGIDGIQGRKRHRMSISPQASKADISGSTDNKRKKRQRVDSHGNAVDQDNDRSFRPDAPAMVANMVASPIDNISPATSQGTAPVAFMGASTTSPVTKSPTELHTNSTLISPVNSIDQALSRKPDQEGLQVQLGFSEQLTHKERGGQAPESQALIDKTQSDKDVGRSREAKAEQEKQAQARSEEADRQAQITHQMEEARREEERRSTEAEQQIRLEKEQEEARLIKLKREEDLLQQRRIEQERLRKEEQERKRREFEERENLRRLKMQEEEERQRLQSLPNGLRRAAELGPEEAKREKLIKHWLPLKTVETQDIDPRCDPQVAEERWIANIQAAPILAVRDLTLSQFTAWSRRPATLPHHGSLWRHFRVRLAQAPPSPFLSPLDCWHLDAETLPKFMSLPHVFWIKLSDFMDIVPRYQHLVGVHLRVVGMVLHEFPFGRGGTWERPVGGVATGQQGVGVVKLEGGGEVVMMNGV